MKNLEGVRFPLRLRQQSGCLVIVIPRKVCRELGWTSGNYLSVRYEGETVIVSRLNLGQDSPLAREHHRVPPGKHGDWIRKEQAAKASRDGS